MVNFVSKFHNLFPPASLILKIHGLEKYNNVLDLGCGGNSVLKVFNNRYKYGVDAFDEYIQMSEIKKIHHEYLLTDITKMNLNKILPKFDAVIVFDVLEHLENEKCQELIESLENSPNIKFIAFRTPSLYLEQGDLDNNEFQRHKSFLKADFFKNRGYIVYGVDGPIFLNVLKNRPRQETNLIKSFLSFFLRPIFLFFPEYSMNYLAILKK
jgi:hypothetical protein